MEFTKIRLIGLYTVDFPIHNALPSSPYLLKGVDGLGPPESTVLIARTLEQGGSPLGRQTPTREITMRVGLNPNYKQNQTVASLREVLYGLLTPATSDNISVRLIQGHDTVAVTVGQVSKIEIVPFAKEPEVQIVIPCFESFLNGPQMIVKSSGGKNPVTIHNQGNAPTGFEMEVVFNGSPDGFRIDGVGGHMEFDYQFEAGDKLQFDTRPGKRSVTVDKGANVVNIIYSLTAVSKWLILRGGANAFTPSTSGWAWGYFRYTPQFWGV